MELTLSNLVRTMQTKFRIGNFTLKDVSGTISLRNAADSADASIIAASAKFTTSPVSGYVLTTDGSGNGTWASPSYGEASPSNRIPAASVTVAAGYSLVVSGFYELPVGITLDLASNGALEIL